MIRGTTPTFILKISDASVDLTKVTNIYASFSQNNVKIVKTGEDLVVAPQEVDVYLTQEETLRFVAGTLNIQLNWTYQGGQRACTNIVGVNVGINLIGRVLE